MVIEKNKTLHLVMVPFRGVGLDFRDDEWFAQRIEIFKNYTLKSLHNQTNQDFVLWLSFRPQDRHNPLVLELMGEIKHRAIFTFDGLMYWDDKFGGGFKQIIKNVGRVIRGWWRGQMKLSYAFYLLKNPNKTLADRLKNSLAYIEQIYGNPDKVLMTRIDSDDMFANRAMEVVRGFYLDYPNRQAICLQKGFIYNTTTRELAQWNPQSNPPFYTLVFDREVFFNSPKHLEFYGDFKSHEDIPKQFEHCSSLRYDRFYCVTTSDPKLHTSTNWNHPFRGKIVDKELLKNFI